MNQRTIWIVCGSLVLGAFLVGFVPQYLKTKGVESRLSATHQELNSARDTLQKDELALLIGYVYLETNMKNYGLASQSSSKFFDRARTMAGETSDSDWQALLQSVLAKRDAVTAGLAKGDPGMVTAVQDLFQSTLKRTRTGQQ